MKHLLYVLLGVLAAQPSYGNPIDSPDQAYAYAAVGRNTAAVYWSSKNCMALGSGLASDCLTTPNPDLYTPTVAIFNGKTGDIIKHIKFFDESCAYTPVSLTGDRGRAVTLIVHVGGGLLSGIGSTLENNYPDCPYSHTESIMLTETRSIRSGKLISNTKLQDITTYSFD